MAQNGAPLPPPPAPAASAPAAPAPVPATQAAPATPIAQSPFVVALLAQWRTFLAVFKGDTVGALRLAQTVPLYWVAYVASFSALIGLFVATSIARGLATIGDFTSDIVYSLTNESYYGSLASSYFNISFSTWITYFFVAAIFYALIFFARALTVWWVFPLRGQKATFGQAANLVAVSFVPQVISTAFFFVLVLIPSAAFIALLGILATLIYPLFGFISELVLYTGINREAPFTKSPVIMHALMTGVFGVLAVVAWTVFGSILVS